MFTGSFVPFLGGESESFRLGTVNRKVFLFSCRGFFRVLPSSLIALEPDIVTCHNELLSGRD